MTKPGGEQPGVNPPLVSVVIPCRNAAPWLAETLQSALAQDLAASEIIVVDDGSTDESAAIAESLGPRVRVVRQGPRGVSAARNAGTQASRGRYLQYLDADDVLEAGTIDRRVVALEASGADVALTPFVRWVEQADGTYRAEGERRRTLGERPDVDLLTEAWWPPGAILYRRAMVDRIGPWRVDLPIIQDARFLLDAALHGARFIHVDALGLRYRVHAGASLSRRDPDAFVDDCYRSAAELHDRWSGTDALDQSRRRALVYVFAYVARASFAGNRPRFEAALHRIETLDPHFRPAQPWTLRALSNVIGYRSAEHVALWWRQLKGAAAASPGSSS
jgi:glycosyltransferase involved in cell wall biosynthesis